MYVRMFVCMDMTCNVCINVSVCIPACMKLTIRERKLTAQYLHREKHHMVGRVMELICFSANVLRRQQPG